MLRLKIFLTSIQIIALFYPPCWFFHNNSEMVKAIILSFCSIQWHFIKDIRAKFNIPNLSQSQDTAQNSYGGICDFGIYSLSLIKENCRNSRTSDDIGMKLGSVTKLDKRSCRKIVKSLSILQFMVNLEQSRSRIPDAQSAKLMSSIIITLYLTQSENITKKSLAELLNYCFD